MEYKNGNLFTFDILLYFYQYYYYSTIPHCHLTYIIRISSFQFNDKIKQIINLCILFNSTTARVLPPLIIHWSTFWFIVVVLFFHKHQGFPLYPQISPSPQLNFNLFIFLLKIEFFYSIFNNPSKEYWPNYIFILFIIISDIHFILLESNVKLIH